jgi:hypothetical protein
MIVWFDVLLPLEFVAIKEIVYVPEFAKFIIGLVAAEVVGFPPGKDHEYDVGLPVEVFVNVTD